MFYCLRMTKSQVGVVESHIVNCSQSRSRVDGSDHQWSSRPTSWNAKSGQMWNGWNKTPLND